MSAEKLEQSELEQLTAYVDGELPADEASVVAERIAADPTWAAVADELAKLDGLLDAWDAPPLRRDLTEAIVIRTAQRPGMPRWVRLAAPLATAAAVLLLVWAFRSFSGNPEEPEIASTPRQTVEQKLVGELATVIGDLSEEDRFAVENLDVLENYDVLTDFETLEAIAEIERNAEAGDS